MKRFIILLLLSLFIHTAGAGPVTNLTATPYTDSIDLTWSGDSTYYTVGIENDTIIYTDTPPYLLDGIIDPVYAALSHTFTVYTPNPVYLNQYDEIYLLHDGDYIYIGADCNDNDAKSYDDGVRFFIDVDGDGLDLDDRSYTIFENNLVKRYDYNGAGWSQVPTAADGAVSGAGTTNFQMEFKIPLTELGPAMVNGSWHKILIRRECAALNPTVYRYYPHEQCVSADELDSTDWADMQLADEGETTAAFITETSNTYYTVNSNLCPFNWYRLWVCPEDDYGNCTKTETITLNTPLYNVTGCVYDHDTGDQLFNAVVYVTNSFVSTSTLTNRTGCFELQGIYNGSFTITAQKDNYINYSVPVLIDGADVTGLELYLQYDPSADITENSTTDIKTVYLMTAVALVFLIISIFCICSKGVDVVSLFTMLIPTITCFKISNLYLDGTLTNTQKFISSADTIIVKKEILRNTAASNLYEFIAIGLFVIILLQLYILIKNMKVERDF